MVTQPVSDVNTLGTDRPVDAVENLGGVYGSNGSSSESPFIAGKPEPCSYGPCTCKSGQSQMRAHTTTCNA